MTEWGIFNDESADHSADEALEAQMYSREEAEARLAESYADDPWATVHECESPDEREDDE